MRMQGAPKTVSAYIARQDRKTQTALRRLRAVVMKSAPEATERLSYGMPAYFMKRVLVYFAAWEKHIGFYPGARAIEVFEKDIARYVHAKGSIQFPLERPLPVALAARIVRFRVAEVTKKDAEKAKSAKKSGNAKKASAPGKRQGTVR